MDAFLSSGALIVLSPVLLVTAALVRFRLGTPVLFSQKRPGRDGKLFKLYKFRSMTDARDSVGKLLPDDDRLTPFGRALRSTSIDELPELLNIVKGDMSVVGPRPLLTEYLPYYTETERQRHDVRPGLSGLAQVHGRNTITWEEKFAKDLEYVRRITFMGDMKIIFQTIIKTVKRSDIRVGKEHIAGRLDKVRSLQEGEQSNECVVK
ncbi:MAG: sugar transferase [Dorea sp.]|nr:sugar transferase [Dorea sp.]